MFAKNSFSKIPKFQNGTVAGLGYFEVIWIAREKVLHGQ
jgi:hypothetical protein